MFDDVLEQLFYGRISPWDQQPEVAYNQRQLRYDLCPVRSELSSPSYGGDNMSKEILAKDIDEIFLGYYTFAHMRDYPDREETIREIVDDLDTLDGEMYIEEIKEIADDKDSEYGEKARDLLNRLIAYYKKIAV